MSGDRLSVGFSTLLFLLVLSMALPLVETKSKPLIPDKEYLIRLGSPKDEVPVSVRIGPEGEAYLYGTTDFYFYDRRRQLFLVRVDGEKVEWQLIFGSRLSENPISLDVSAGKLFLTGNVEAGCPYPFLITINRTGDVITSLKITGDKCLRLKAAQANAGQAYLAGEYGNSGFVVRMDEEKVLWAKSLKLVPEKIHYSMGYVYVAGKEGKEVWLAKLTADRGELIWAVRLSLPEGIEVRDLYSHEDIFLAGSTSEDGLLVKISPLGEVLWAIKLKSTGPIEKIGGTPLRAIGNLPDGRCWIAQFGEGSADWYVAWGGRLNCKDLEVEGDYAYLLASGGGEVSGESFYVKPAVVDVRTREFNLKLNDLAISLDGLDFYYANRGLKRNSGEVVLMKVRVDMSSPSDFCSLTFNGFPEDFKYFAVTVDGTMNGKELKYFRGRGDKEASYTVILGGPMINRELNWESYGVKFFVKGGHYAGFTFRGRDYLASYGKRDYAVIVYDCDSMRVWIGGITRYGTRAGLLWLLDHPDYVEKGVVVVKWEGEGEVRPWEITVVAHG